MGNKFLKSKEEIAQFAAAHNLDLSYLSYTDQCKCIKGIEEEEAKAMGIPNEPSPSELSSQKYQAIKAQKQQERRSAKQKTIKDFYGKTIVIAPEIRPQTIQPVKYDEVLGDDLEVEEIYYDINQAMATPHAPNGVNSGTYKIKGKTGRKVIAQSTLPKQNAAITWPLNPNIVLPVITFQGRSGYPWSHPSMQSFSQLLKDSGYYYDYEGRLNGTNNLFYLTGILCIDINVANGIMNDIQRKHQERKRNGSY